MWLVYFTFYVLVLLSTCLSDNSSKLTLHIRSRYSIIACAKCAKWSTIQTLKCLSIHTVLHTHLKSTLTHSQCKRSSESATADPKPPPTTGLLQSLIHTLHTWLRMILHSNHSCPASMLNPSPEREREGGRGERGRGERWRERGREGERWREGGREGE